MTRCCRRLAASLSAGAALALLAPAAPAQKARPAAAAKKKPANKNGDKKPEERSEEGKPASEGGARPTESKPRSDTSAPSTEGVTQVTEDKEGVKTYKFKAQEVEGRLKSPQVGFFLRRVRAEFAAGDLGHRSFLGELRHTRHHKALR